MSFKDNKENDKPFHSDHKIINMPLKNVQSRESSLCKHYVGQHVHFHDHTYSYKQSYTHESCQNEISTNKSIDSAHCARSKELKRIYLSACHFAVVLQLGKEG